MMLFIRRQYDGQSHELEVRDDLVFERPAPRAAGVIPVNGINRSVVQAVMFGKSLATDASMLQAVFVTTDLEEAELLRVRWDRQLPGVPLVVVESPYRALVGPVVTYLDVLDHAWPPDKEAPTTIVVLPEYVARRWWDRLLYNQAAKRLKTALVGREHTVIADVPYRRSEHTPASEPAPGHARGRPEHAHDRRTAPPQGPQARRTVASASSGRTRPTSATPAPTSCVAKPEASRAAHGARAVAGSAPSAWLIGRPLASEEEIGERLSKRLALPIFSSDAISSSAYATEEILRVLVVGGALAFIFSDPGRGGDRGPARRRRDLVPPAVPRVPQRRRRVCRRAPGADAAARPRRRGGAAHRLRDDGRGLDVVGGGAADLDRRRTSTRSAIAIALTSIALITIGEPPRPARVREHLRGPDLPVRGPRPADRGDRRGPDRERRRRRPCRPSAEAMQLGTRDHRHPAPAQGVRERLGRADRHRGDRQRRAGVQAARGEERGEHAGRDGRAARDPVHRDHVVADAYQIVPSEEGSGGPTVIALVAQTAFGAGNPLFYVFQMSTALILFLAANTSYNAFPRLAALLAADGFMPRQFAFRGDRLAFSWGIILLSAGRGGAARRLRRRHDAADPALLGRRVRVLHAQPERAWSSTGGATRSPAGDGGWRSTRSGRC